MGGIVLTDSFDKDKEIISKLYYEFDNKKMSDYLILLFDKLYKALYLKKNQEKAIGDNYLEEVIFEN